jgi:hypothetical protein
LDKQVDVMVFAIHLDQSRCKVRAYLGEYSPKTGHGLAIEHAIAVFGEEDQMYVHCENTVSAVQQLLLFAHKPSTIQDPDGAGSMRKAYRYNREPNPSQRYALARTLDVCRELYNDGLYQRTLQPLRRYQQSEQLTQLKAEFPVYKNVYSQVLQHVLDRLDNAFQSFFCSGFGFPRCKGANRFDSFTYPQAGFSLGGRQLSLAKIGNVKVRLSRPLPPGAVVKTCTIKRSVNGWFATLAFEHQPVPLPAKTLT